MTIIYRGLVGGVYQYWSANEVVPIGATNIVIASIPVTGSAGGFWQSDITGTIYATGSVNITGSLVVGNNSGRGLLKVGTLDISPITGSAQTDSINTSAIIDGDLLSASYGVWDGINSVALRHEIHVLAIGYDSYSNLNQIAATFLVMTHINSFGNQTAIDIVEVSKEYTGSYAADWEVNVTNDCSLIVNGYTNYSNVYWYIQRTKEMGLRNDGSRT